MKKIIGFKIDFGSGESRSIIKTGIDGHAYIAACDYMMVTDLPDDAPIDELYAEIDPVEIPGEGHWEGEIEQELAYEGDEFHDPVYRDVDNREWIEDDGYASAPILRQMISDKASEEGFEVLYCGDGDDIPAEFAAYVLPYRPVNFGGILIVSYEADEEEA